MASSVVDRKFLATLAKETETANPFLSSTLYKILGLSIRLAPMLVTARKQRRRATRAAEAAESQHLHHRILWLAREGLVMLEQYVLPMVTNSNQLKVLAYKLRASLYHIIVLFHNQPPVHATFEPIREPEAPAPGKVDKGKGKAREEDMYSEPDVYREGESYDWPSSLRRPDYEGGPVVAPPPGFGPPPGFKTEQGAAFLLPVGDYLPRAIKCFRDAEDLADRTLWGSHSLRLSIKTEFSSFLYECLHDEEGSRKLARQTINEVYEATEGIDNDMFQDACELVTVLGKMMKRGLPPSTRSKGSSPATTGQSSSQPEGTPPTGAPVMSAAQAQPPGPLLAPQPLFAEQPGTTQARARSRSHSPVVAGPSISTVRASTPTEMPPASIPPASQAQPGFI